MFTGWAAVPGANHTNPCQSTGLWFAIPSDASKRFLRHLLVWLLDVRLSQWDQAAWNEVGRLVQQSDASRVQPVAIQSGWAA